MALLADLVLPRPERSCGKVTSLCSPSNSTSLSDRFPSLQHGQQMTTNYYFYALYWPCLCCSVTRLHFTYSPSTTPTFCAKYKLDLLSVFKSLKRLTVPCLADDCQLDANITSADTLPLCHTCSHASVTGCLLFQSYTVEWSLGGAPSAGYQICTA